MTPEIAEKLKESLDAVASVREIDAPKAALTVETLDARLKVVEKVISSLITKQIEGYAAAPEQSGTEGSSSDETETQGAAAVSQEGVSNG